MTSLAAPADAYVVKKTTHGDLVHWEERTVSYAIDAAIDANVARANGAVVEALESWSGTVGAPELTIARTAEPIPNKPAFDGTNAVYFMKDGYAPAGRALAITVLTYDNTSGRILDADVIFNGSYSFQVLSPNATGKRLASSTHLSNTDSVTHEEQVATARDVVYDLHHVIAHELGHSLGMNDEMGERQALMYRYSAPNDASIRQPGSDDIAGLAELYSTKMAAQGNGCGGATVAPKKPAAAASQLAMVGTLAFLLFLALRARSDRRARVGFVLAAAAAAIALVPTLSGKRGPSVAHAGDTALFAGHARGKVLAATTAIEDGLFRTTYRLATTDCRAATCPQTAQGASWGGTIGNVTQEVGGYYAPAPGDDVDVSFDRLPGALAPLTSPLAGRALAKGDAVARVVTRHRELSRADR